MKIKLLIIFVSFWLGTSAIFAQDIALYQQFNGRYDFTFIGNTMNVAENTANDPCLILTSSTATLALTPGDVIQAAFLYWAGSGPGEFDVKLNGADITAERTFGLTWINSGLPFFSAFADVTTQVQAIGNGNYTLSDLDIAPFLNPVDYCSNGTNFGGWAILVIYKNPALPLNQINVYDGLQNVPYEINITLNSLNVIDNQDAKIGFLAWEGDKALAFNESLRINGNDISNPPLNPADNAFNGTNSFTTPPAIDLYNMDMDVYNIQNNISIGDTTAEIQLTSGMPNVAVSTDFVMINTIITKLNSQLPDATVSIDNVAVACRSRSIVVDFTVYNVNSTNDLPAGVPISIYANGIFIGYTETLAPIIIGGSVSDQITLLIPDEIADNFQLTFVVDDIGDGTGIVTELLETNNTDNATVSFYIPPPFNIPPDLTTCNLGLGSGLFDFSEYPDLIRVNPDEVITFHTSLPDAENNMNPIINTSSFTAQVTPMEIFVRIDDGLCFSITSFKLLVKNCPITIYNYVSANNDGSNDTFFIDGLRDIFVNFDLEIYNRWGVLIWTGNNNTEDWNGHATKGVVLYGDHVPDGTYFYVLKLNDPDYQTPYTGFLYLVKG